MLLPSHRLCTELRDTFGTITFLRPPLPGHVLSCLFPSLLADCGLCLTLAS